MDTYTIMNIPAVINLIKLSLDNTLDSNAWWIFFVASPRQICKRIHYHYLKQLPEVTKPVNLTEVPLPSWQYPLHTSYLSQPSQPLVV